MRFAALAGALACGLVIASCDTEARFVELGPLDASPDCEVVRGHSDLATIQTEIFDKNCASSTACHKTSIDDSSDLSLADGMSYTDLVNVVGVAAKSSYAVPPPKGKGQRQWLRVDPSGGEAAAQNSYLMVLIDPHANPQQFGPSDPTGMGYGTAADLDPMVGSMPVNAGGLLCDLKIQAIHDWIVAGALPQ